MKKTDQSQADATLPAKPSFRNRDNAESQVCQAFTALGVLAGVDVDQGNGPDDLDADLIQAAYESNFSDPHFLGGPFCFNYAKTKDQVDALAEKARAVTDGFAAYIRAHGTQESIQEADGHIAVIEAAIAWLRKTNRSL